MLVLRQKLSDPVFLLAVVAALGAFVVQSGELGSSDTTHRLQVAHSFWTSEPPVFPQEYPEFGLHGRGGRLQSWYGMGQSLLMLPADIIGTYIERLPMFARYKGNDPAVRSIVVSYVTNILVNVLTVLIALRFLRQLGFSIKQSVAGVLALLFCTTHLHYTQNMMENNYIMLLTLVGFSFQFEWLSTGSRRALLIGSAALGLNLLTRLTTGLDLLARAFRHHRSPVPVLSVRVIHQHLRHNLRTGISSSGSGTPSELSVGNAVPHGLPWPPHHSGEVDLSF